ncbi:MAG: DUF3750 domain-containing protein [Rhizobiaceae bacterium]
MIRFFRRVVLFVVLVFILPVLVSLLVWQADEGRPANWHSANWSTANLLPPANAEDGAVIHVMAARTGRWKGAFSVHSWIVTKKKDEDRYNRYDKVGWGNPIRLNAYAADANWYSNSPKILKTYKGKEATNLIPKIEMAIADYPFAYRGGYNIWPGPNSNTFVAHVLNEVPEMQLVLPANAVGRDFPVYPQFFNLDPDWSNLQASLNGYAGFAIGKRSGIEFQFLGLVAGFDFSRPGLKLPGFGTVNPI